jgi:trimeric autotransporter adhesin
MLMSAGLAGGVLVAAAPAAGGATGQGLMTTVAGGPGRGLASTVSQSPQSIAVGPGGVIYAGDWNGVVRAFTGAASWEKVAAGVGVTGYGPSGDGGPAVRARLGSAPGGLTVDGAGNLLLSDTGAYQVRLVAAASGTFYGQAMTAKGIYTIAGDGISGYSGDGGPATSAELRQPEGLAVDAAGNVLIADRSSNRVRVVAAASGTFYGRAMTAGDIYTIAGNGTYGYSGDGGPATSAELRQPDGLAVDAAGNVLIADHGSNRVRVVAAASGTFYGQAMTAGDIYTIAGNGTSGYSGDGGPAVSAELKAPEAVAIDAAGNVVVADTLNNRLRVVAARTGSFYGQAMTAGDIYTVAGTGRAGYSGNAGPAASAELDFPEAVAVDTAGNLVIGDTDNDRVRIVAARTGSFYGVAMTAGDIYAVAGNGVFDSSGDGGKALNAEVSPQGVAVSAAGNIAIADGSARVRVVAAATGTLYGQPVTAGDIYTIAGNGTFGLSGDGGPATSAQLNTPGTVAVDGAGNLLISDTSNNRIRVVAGTSGTFYGQAMTAGDIYTIAGGGHLPVDGVPATSAIVQFPESVAVDAAGNVLISETADARVRVVAAAAGTFYGQAMTAGDIYTIAGNGTSGYSGDGGPATSAELSTPAGLAVDGTGNVIIADPGNNRVRIVAAATGTFYGQPMTAGDIYTIAGNGQQGYDGDNGAATSRKVNAPQAVAVDNSGNLLIADTGNSRIRVVAGKPGTFYGQPMTAGDIYTIAGNGHQGFLGDTGVATSTRLSSPRGVTVGATGDVIISDTGNYRVRGVGG